MAFGKKSPGRSADPASLVQLPYLAYPESPPLWGMQDYDPLRGYLHTTGLHWSYGAVEGRPDALWQEATAALPIPAMVERLRARHFAAIWVQSNGYEDGGVAIRHALNQLLGPPLATEANGPFAVWRL